MKTKSQINFCVIWMKSINLVLFLSCRLFSNTQISLYKNSTWSDHVGFCKQVEYLAAFTDDMSKYIITNQSCQLFHPFGEAIALCLQSYLMPTGALQGTVLSTLNAHN